MPRIPVKLSDTVPEITEISPQTEGSVWGEVAQAGERVAQAGERVAQTSRQIAGAFDAINKAQDAVETMRLKGLIDADFDAKAIDYSKRTDYVNYDKSAQDDIDQLRSKYEEELRANPRIADQVGAAFEVRSRHFINTVMVKKAQEITEEGKFQAVKYADAMAVKYASAPTQEERTAIENELRIQFKDLEDRNIVPREFAYKVEKGWRKRAEESIIVNGMASTNVEYKKRVLEELNAGGFSTLDEKERGDYAYRLTRSIESAQKDADRKAKEQSEKFAYDDLSALFRNKDGKMYDMIAVFMSSPKAMEAYKLSPDSHKAVQALFSSEQANLERSKEPTYQDTFAEGFEALSNNTLKPEDVTMWLSAGRIKPADAKYLREELIQLAKEEEEGKEPKTSIRVYDAVLTRIAMMNPFDASDVEKVKGLVFMVRERGAVSTEDGKDLIKRINTRLQDKDLFADPWVHRAEVAIKTSLGWTEQLGFMALDDPKAAANASGKVTMDLVKAVKNEGLKGDEILKRAYQLVLPHQQKIWTLFGRGGGTTPPPVTNQPTPSPSPKERPTSPLVEGKVYVDKDGKRRRFDGVDAGGDNIWSEVK